MSCAYLLLLRTLRAVLRTALLTVLDALGIKDTAQHVITHAGKVAHTSATRSEEHTPELQSLMRLSYAVFCLKKKTTKNKTRQKQSSMTNVQKARNQTITLTVQLR